MRFALAIVVIAVAWAGALYLRQHQFTRSYVTSCRPNASAPTFTLCPQDLKQKTFTAVEVTHPSWKDPVVVLIGVGAVAVAAGIAFSPRHAA